MSMDWFRWHHGSVADPKWRLVARRAKVRVADVVAVWAMMLEAASANRELRGVISGWLDEAAAVCLDLDEKEVAAIREAMQGVTLEGMTVTGWDKRQPKRERDEGGASTARSQAHRHRQQQEQPRNATQRHATHGNAPDEMRREENPPHPQSAIALANQIEEIAGADRAKSRRWAMAPKIVAEWIVRGADPEKHILEGVRETMLNRGDEGPPEGPEYFWPSIQRLMQGKPPRRPRQSPQPSGVVIGAFQSGSAYTDAWKAWRDGGKVGPEPKRSDFEQRGAA